MTSKASSMQHAAHDKMPEYERQQHSHRGVQGQGHNNGSDHSGSGDDVIENRIYVGGVPHKMNEQDLSKYFSRYGNVEHVTVIDKTTNMNVNRYGFITFSPCSVGAVNTLLHHTDPADLILPGGRTLTIGPAKQRSRQRPGHWFSGGREDRGQYGENRRRYNHHQPWGRRTDTRNPPEDRFQNQYFRRNDVRSVSEGDTKVVPEVGQENGPIKPPQEAFVAQQPSMESFQPVPVEIMVQQQQQQMVSMGMGYELPPAYPANTIMPSAYPVTMPPAQYGAYGFYDYSFSEQMMIMPPGAAYYNQVGPYQDLYSQQYNYLQDQYLQNYSQQPFDCSMTAYTMPPQAQPLSDSGYFDLSGQSFAGQYHHPVETSILGGKGSDVGDSPVLNMCQAFSGKAPDMKLVNPQEDAPTDSSSGAGIRAARPISTPYKQFHPFNGGYLDPQGNRFPFNRNTKHVRKFSNSRSEQGPIIKPPPTGVMEEREVAKREERKRHVSDSSAVDQLQQAVHIKLAIK